MYKSILLFSLVLGHSVGQAQLFEERASELGIDHFTEDDKAMAGGVALFDFNNDGLLDIYLTGGSQPDQLYENLGQLRFVEVGDALGINAIASRKTMGVVASDYDNDSFTDLLITTDENSANVLFHNNGGTSFTNVASAAGLDDRTWSMTASMADYDLDGDLDIYISNYVAYDALPFEEHITEPLADFFYQNNGDGSFIKLDNPLTPEDQGCTLVSSFTDIDQDGDSDLFVLNDFGDFYIPNKLLRNTYPDLGFTDVSVPLGVRTAINSMGLAVGDVDDDGDFDYYITNIGNNIFYRQTDGTFFNEASEFGINDGTGTSWGTGFIDVDNDRNLDLFVSRGSLINLDDDQPNLLFLGNTGNQTFTDASNGVSSPNPNKARGMAYGDLNNDGALDIVTNNIRIADDNSGKTKVYINNNSNLGNHLQLKLEGSSSNRGAVGALVKVYTSSGVQRRELHAGSSYLSSHSPNLSFGLGGDDHIDSLEIAWPGESQNLQVYKDLKVNTVYHIHENNSIYERQIETIAICPGESVTIQEQTISEAGIFANIIPAENQSEVAVLKIIKVIISTAGEGDCEVSEPVIETPSAELPEMAIVPNPVGTTLEIRHALSLADNVQIVITDLSGRTVREDVVNVKNNSGLIRLGGYEDLPQGVYVLRLISNGESYLFKLIKS